MSGVTCEDARNLFDAHLNGELPGTLETELNAHRLRCPTCRHELAVLEVAGAVITADDGVPTLDDEFAARLMACVSEQQTPGRLRRRRLIRIGTRLLAAAACVVFLVGYFVSRPEKEVAGWRSIRPGSVRAGKGDTRSNALEAPNDRAAAQPSFQSQVERALTGWRNDASSLKKMYRSITPPIQGELSLERSEGVHDQPDLSEPGLPEAVHEGSDAPQQTIEDI